MATPLFRETPLQEWLAKWVKPLLWSAVTALIVVIAIIAYQLRPLQAEPYAVEQLISIPRGSSSQEIAQLLQEEGLIRDARTFTWFSRIFRTDGDLKAGDYLLKASMSPWEIIDTLQAGNVAPVNVTIYEGLNLAEIAQVLADKGLVDPERFLELAQDERLIYGDHPPVDKPVATLEGYLFPDTYRFVRGQREEEIIKIMVNRFLELVPPLVAENGVDMNLHEVMTLASIVEKEALYDSERPLIAGVFHNRLRIGMRLQADPTVRYVMEEQRNRVLYRDLEIDSPYNTYRYAGLPPGPIASPGLASIKAVINPADVDYMYFVAKGDGTHAFSRTFAEHVANRQKFGY
ncbi:MAG: endolytic transglycosylase MltG [Limnochordia bacterium]|jgi:UPF0755 protein